MKKVLGFLSIVVILVPFSVSAQVININPEPEYLQNISKKDIVEENIEAEHFEILYKTNEVVGYDYLDDRTLRKGDEYRFYSKPAILKEGTKLYTVAVATSSVSKMATRVFFINKAFAGTEVYDTYDTSDSKQIKVSNASYSTAHDATTGTVDTLYGGGSLTVLHNSLYSGNYLIRRGEFRFNTTAIDDEAEITGVTLSMYTADSHDTAGYDVDFFNNTDNPNLNHPLVSEDFNDFGTDVIGSKDLTDYDNANTNVDFVFATTSMISVTGYTHIGLRLSGDTDYATAPTAQNTLNVDYSIDIPYLTITITDPPTATSSDASDYQASTDVGISLILFLISFTSAILIFRIKLW